MKYYDYKRYESQCLYFNEIDRIKTYHVDDSYNVKYNIIGYDDSYESVSEYYIVQKYMNNVLKKDKNINLYIKILYIIDKELRYLLNRNLITCMVYTIKKYINDKSKDINEHYVGNKKEKRIKELYDIKKNISFIKKLYKMSYKNQIKLVSKSNILQKKNMMNRLDIIKNNYIFDIVKFIYIV